MKTARQKTKRTGLPPQLRVPQKNETGWRLISGQALAEFVLRSGLVAPRLLYPAPRE